MLASRSATLKPLRRLGQAGSLRHRALLAHAPCGEDHTPTSPATWTSQDAIPVAEDAREPRASTSEGLSESHMSMESSPEAVGVDR